MVQGDSTRDKLAKLTHPVVVFGLAFTATSVLSFAAVGWVGDRVDGPAPRVAVALVVLVGIAAAIGHEALVLRQARYCAIGPRRQTPKLAELIDQAHVVSLVWGADTGLGVTTYRMTNGWWVAALAVFAGVAGPVAVGLAYGVAFSAALTHHLRPGVRSRRGEAAELRRHLPLVRCIVLALEVATAGVVVAHGLG